MPTIVSRSIGHSLRSLAVVTLDTAAAARTMRADSIGSTPSSGVALVVALVAGGSVACTESVATSGCSIVPTVEPADLSALLVDTPESDEHAANAVNNAAVRTSLSPPRFAISRTLQRAEGLPALRLGRLIRIPRWAADEMISTGPACSASRESCDGGGGWVRVE